MMLIDLVLRGFDGGIDDDVRTKSPEFEALRLGEGREDRIG